ncbi:NUBP2 [Enterospora canceri]|uniref:NUBP2 n=1 Tax=Enterospora canceri TaxID=1081671 RepID=A0A1Y1S637_9MICR|nr:NUBP2 [Enterospora canceri]
MNSCPGVGSKEAGVAEGCKGCPSAEKCKTAKPDPDIDRIKERLKQFKQIVAIMCGKGGVGKSFMSVQLASHLKQHHNVLLIDFDLSGPSIPKLTQTENHIISNIDDTFDPIDANGYKTFSVGHINTTSDIFDSSYKTYLIKKILKNCNFDNCDILIIDTPPNITDEHIASHLKQHHNVLLIDFDLSGPSIPKLTQTENHIISNIDDTFDPIDANGYKTFSVGHINTTSDIFDSSYKTYLIKKILKNCNFDNCDILIIDTPPNITDEHIALFNYIKECSTVLISTPHPLAMSDLNRQLSFCKKAKMRVLGVVENMSGIECIECGHINDVFGTGAVELFSTKNSLIFLGRINFSIKMCRVR